MYRLNIDVEKFKNPIFYTVCIAGLCQFVLYTVGLFASYIYNPILHHPGWYVFGLIFSDLHVFFLLIMVFLGILLVVEKRKKDMTYTELYKQKGFMSKVILFSIVGWLVFEALIIPNGVVINFHKTNKLSLEYLLIKDICQDNTTIVELPSEQIDNDSYRDKRRHIYESYVMYMQDDNNPDKYKYSSVELSKIISIIEELKKYEKKITIEYYSNTGFIKKIDGIDKMDFDSLEERVKKLDEEQQKSKKKDLYVVL